MEDCTLMHTMTSGKIYLRKSDGYVPRVQENEGNCQSSMWWRKACRNRTWAVNVQSSRLLNCSSPIWPLTGRKGKVFLQCKRQGPCHGFPASILAAEILTNKLASYAASLRNYWCRPGCSHSEPHLPLPPRCWDRKWMPLYLALASCYCETISNCLELLVKNVYLNSRTANETLESVIWHSIKCLLIYSPRWSCCPLTPALWRRWLYTDMLQPKLTSTAWSMSWESEDRPMLPDS